MTNNFAVFILSHGRAERIKTLKALKKGNYTGRVYIVVDNEDSELEKYKEKYGDKVKVFNKDEIAKTFDCGINTIEKRAIVFARNACFMFAKELGLEYFIELDDDYEDFVYKFDWQGKYNDRMVKSLDSAFAYMLEYFEKIPALTIAMAQGGDFIGGKNSGVAKEIGTKRKAMNSFFCSTARPFSFVGNINEDVNTYVSLGNKGQLLFTVMMLALNQGTTQKNAGGMTGAYLDKGTYYKSFYSVMYAPASVKIALMGQVHKRIHHKVSWNNTAVKIIPEHYKKL